MTRSNTTPCRVTQATAKILDDETVRRQSVTLHARKNPCGIIDRDESVAVAAEEIIGALAGRAVDVRRCNYCGGHLRDVSDNGDRDE